MKIHNQTVYRTNSFRRGFFEGESPLSESCTFLVGTHRDRVLGNDEKEHTVGQIHCRCCVGNELHAMVASRAMLSQRSLNREAQRPD